MLSFRKKFVLYLTIAFLVCLAIVGHSSSFFVISLVLCLMAFENKKFYTKQGLIIVLAASLPLGFLFSSAFSSAANVFMNAISGYDALERTTHYLVENVYGNVNASIVKHSLQTLTAIIFVMYAKENEIHSFFLRCFCVASIVNVFLQSIPLVNRSMTLLFVLGCIGAVPTIRKEMDFLWVIMILNAYMCYRWYVSPVFNLSWSFLWN